MDLPPYRIEQMGLFLQAGAFVLGLSKVYGTSADIQKHCLYAAIAKLKAILLQPLLGLGETRIASLPPRPFCFYPHPGPPACDSPYRNKDMYEL